MKPMTVDEAQERGLLVDNGIHTFSNGTERECWSEGNCWECRWYDWDEAGACAFDSASLIGQVSPALAVLFGWTERAEYPGSYEAPDRCPFFAQRKDDDDDTPDEPRDSTDPAQLVLLADPTEDAAVIVNAPELEIVEGQG